MTIRYDIPGVGIIPPGVPFSLDSVRYPANWLEHADAGWLSQHGITLVGPAPDDLAAYAADKRFRVETGGIVLASLPVCTDRATQAMLSRTVQLLDKGMLSAPLNIKMPDGFVSLSQQDIEAIGAAVAQHVQAAFDVELAVLAGIAGETITTIEQIDQAAWPSNG